MSYNPSKHIGGATALRGNAGQRLPGHMTAPPRAVPMYVTSLIAQRKYQQRTILRRTKRMRKATGKVVSLVLALALVVTSFSSTLAFAARKTETGSATIDTNKDLYLANINGNEYDADEDGQALKEAEKYFNLTEYIFNDAVKLETYDHIIVSDEDDDGVADGIEISQVTVSGDNIVKVTKLTSDNSQGTKDDYIVSVRDTKGTGKATLNVLLTADATRGDDEITVRGSVKINVTLLDAETPILAPSVQTTPGKALDSFSGLKKNYSKQQVSIDGKNYYVTSNSAVVVLPKTNGSAIAHYVPQTLYTKGESNATYGTNENVYVIAATGTRNYLPTVDGQNSVTYGVLNPAVGNTVRLTAYSVKAGDTKDPSGNAYMVVNKTVDSVTVRVENKVVGNVAEIDVGDGEYHDNVNGKFADDDDQTLLSKSKTYAEMADGSYWDVTGAVVDDDTDGLTITAGRVGDVSADDAVTVNDGTVGNLVVSSGNIVLDGGSLTSAKAETGDIEINGATVGEVKDAGVLTVTSGKVTGAVSADEVMLNPANDEEPVSVGAVSATKLTIDGTVAAAAAGAFKMGNAENVDKEIVLIGKNASVSAIDFDYRDGDLVFQNFAGTVPAPTKASFTGYDMTGADIRTNDDEDEDDTNATVSGNLVIQDITLDNGTVAFSGNVKVDNVNGGEATMVINAGALNITESIGTSNTLKIADPADVVAGTLVYTAASEIADESSFIGYGFDMKLVSGTSTDALVVDKTYFSGLTMNKTEAKIVLNTSETFTASAYPAGTSLPEGAYIKFFLEGDENYVSGVDNQNGTATITAKKYDATFDVLNKATLKAQVYDQYDIQLEEYGEAVCYITVIEKPEVSYISDTTGNVDVVAGNTYQFKITSVDGTVPQFAVANDGAVFKLVAQSNEGNDYFFKVQAVGTVGQVCGVYVNKEATPVATLTVSADYTCDTTTVNVPVGGTYQVKITANSMPTLAAGNSIYTVAFASQSGNDYFFKITATENAKAGDVVGFYINGGARAFVATTV